MLPTVGQVLGMEAVLAGEPRVVAGEGSLGRLVRWVHAIELPDAARLLRGGELVLTTGIALPDEEALLGNYVAELAGVGVSAVAVELGRKYVSGLPARFAAAADECGLPLIVFDHEVPFIAITEAVHGRIIEDQLGELRVSARLHEVFTDLAVAGAGAGEVLRQAALLAGRPVILADLSHRVLAFEPAGADPARLLEGFEARSRAVAPAARTGYDPASGWLVTTVGARGEDWGRVILVCDGPPGAGDTVLVERAATTLALGRLLARQQESLERQAHRTLLSAVLAQAYAGPEEAGVRARALGLPVAGRQLLGMVVRFRGAAPGLLAQARVLDVAEAVAEACRAERVHALVGSLDDERAVALLALDGQADQGRLLIAVCAAARQRLADRARHSPGPPAGDPVIGVGSAASGMAEARRSLLEARQVADAAAQAVADGRPYHRLADLRLRGLLYLLADDGRLATFADRELGPLAAYDAAHGTDLTGVLGTYLAAGGNKAVAAARAHLARPTLYERLRHIERILGVSLDAAESRASLHVALLARAARSPGN
ncbi:MAG TPA: PucR family transcriptional regulator ligand-binding domain-containing protein [Streptosporangiaceae bacterium]|nr:PucR family transcriptional regulator ligand-binding domain-containing protein [Streptosporangiaceae bacterium]